MSDSAILLDDHPDLPGWKRWQLVDSTRFNGFIGSLAVREEGRGVRVRMTPRHPHSNLRNHMHGGALLGFVDLSLFAAARGLRLIDGPASTIDLATQFIAGAEIDQPVDAEIELLRETGRLIFMRGLVTQGETIVASFTATIRKSGGQ